MCLETNTAFSVFATAPTSLVKAFKSVRSAAPHLTIGEFKESMTSGSSLLSVNTYRNEIVEYLENLRLITNSLKELREHVSGLVLKSTSNEEVAIEDLEETLAFHESYQPGDLAVELGAYLGTLEDANWIAHSGKPVGDEVTVSVERPPQGESSWVYLQVALQNRITNQLVEQFGYHHGCLQVHYDQLMPQIAPLTKAKLEAAPADFFDDRNAPSGLIMLSCIEQYFSKLISKVVVVDWVEWLIRGHVPCGWSGEFPDGKLIVW